ncbi:MAG TPA: YegS/Rv2252/BmrU family lipid kinase [Chitinophagales bacterium]|nr:YegS/Rv2252/BmrU family lipid kinase [Chitinophagales bacterium]
MSSPESLKILFVINPKSGAKTKTDFKTLISEYFQALPHSIDFFLLDGNDKIESLKSILDKTKPERIVAVGGDGTVTSVAKQVLKTDIAMGIIPAGSANGMARELNIPLDVNEALDVVMNGIKKSADVILINDKEICLHLSDIGMNAQLIKYFEASSLRGMLGYARVVLKVLLRKHRMKVTVESRDEEVSRFALMVAIANASKYGTGATINPEGNLFDGWFEVVIVRKLALVEILKMFLKVQRFDPKKVEVISAKSVTIETSRRMDFQIDGEYMGKVDSIKAKILQGQLNILVPEEKR